MLRVVLIVLTRSLPECSAKGRAGVTS